MLVTALLLPARPAHATILASLDTGIQYDSLRWTISTPSYEPNTLSELTFEGLSATTRATLGWYSPKHSWWIQGQYAFGQIFDGEIQDDDFSQNDRQGLFSRSVHTPTDHNVQMGTFKFGHGWFGWQNFWISPTLGFQWQFTRFKIGGGGSQQLVPPLALDWSGLNSTYSAQWMAMTLGATARYSLSDLPLILIADATFIPYASYTGQGKWNLRPDFRQDPSFEHNGTGFGGALELQAQWRLSPNWRIGLGGRGQVLTRTHASEELHLSSGLDVFLPVPELHSETIFGFFNLTYQW